MSEDLFGGTARRLREDWGVGGTEPGIDEETNWRLLHEALEERIVYLLKNDLGKLTTAMYLLDIAERHYHAALAQPGLEGKAHALAALVLARETERMRTRLYYTRQKRLE